MSNKIPNLLVSVDWLFENLDNKDLIILDATIPKVTSKETTSSDKNQIKNTIFFDIKNTFSDTNSSFPNTALSPDKFEFQAQNLGINNNSCLVVYDDLGIYSSTRVWWLFKLMGFHNIAVLNGGFPAWKEAGYPIEIPKENQLKKGNFTADYQPKKIAYTNDVLSEIKNKDKVILDARSSGRFLGIEQEPRKDIRNGHIPNSKNLPYNFLLENRKFKSKEEIKQIFEELNPENKPMIFSCGTGITASILDFASEIVGYKNTSVYDGSWTEWGSTNNLPIKNDMEKNWSKEEFHAYVLTFAALCNKIQAEEELDFILSKIKKDTFYKIHNEIVNHSEKESHQKIQDYLKENEYSQIEKDELLRDIKSVFFADKTVDSYEKEVFQFLRKLLN